MSMTPLSDLVVALLSDAPPLEDGLDEHVLDQLAASGARRVTRADGAAYSHLILTAVRVIVFDQLADVIRCEVEPRSGDNHGIHLLGDFVRVDLTPQCSLVAALWQGFDHLAPSRAGLSWFSDAFLVDEHARVVAADREVVALAMTVHALDAGRS